MKTFTLFEECCGREKCSSVQTWFWCLLTASTAALLGPCVKGEVKSFVKSTKPSLLSSHADATKRFSTHQNQVQPSAPLPSTTYFKYREGFQTETRLCCLWVLRCLLSCPSSFPGTTPSYVDDTWVNVRTQQLEPVTRYKHGGQEHQVHTSWIWCLLVRMEAHTQTTTSCLSPTIHLSTNWG